MISINLLDLLGFETLFSGATSLNKPGNMTGGAMQVYRRWNRSWESLGERIYRELQQRSAQWSGLLHIGLSECLDQPVEGSLQYSKVAFIIGVSASNTPNPNHPGLSPSRGLLRNAPQPSDGTKESYSPKIGSRTEYRSGQDAIKLLCFCPRATN